MPKTLWNMPRRLFVLALAMLWVFPQSIRAEEKSADPSDPSNFASDVSVTPPPPPPPPPQEDRKKGSGAAQALAIVGAALAGAGCAMLMAQAAKEPDPSKKKELMAQALQQCAQAAQSAANAAQNKDGEKKITTDDTPKEAQLKAEFANKGQPAEKNAMKLPADSAREVAAETEMPVAATETDAGVVEPSAFDAGPETSDEEIQVAVDANSKTMLKPIDPAKVNFDDNAKPGGETPAAGGSSGFSASVTASNKAAIDAEMKKLSGPISMEEGDPKGTSRKGTTLEGAAGEGSDGDGKGGSGGSGDAQFDAMLAQIMGGGAPGGAAPMGGRGGEIIAFKASRGKGREEPLPNIFQYASYRFRKAGYEEKLIRTAPLRPRGKSASLTHDGSSFARAHQADE